MHKQMMQHDTASLLDLFFVPRFSKGNMDLQKEHSFFRTSSMMTVPLLQLLKQESPATSAHSIMCRCHSPRKGEIVLATPFAASSLHFGAACCLSLILFPQPPAPTPSNTLVHAARRKKQIPTS